MKVAIIGGGAAGFFAAVSVKENYPQASVSVFEKSSRLMTKIKLSGGGRCNITNACSSQSEFFSAYPRGGKQLRKVFKKFSNFDAMKWFEQRGVPLVVQDDFCVFPKSQDSQSIINYFLNLSSKTGVHIELETEVIGINLSDDNIRLIVNDEVCDRGLFDKVIVTTGGIQKKSNAGWIENLGHRIEKPVPSLFTFNMPGEHVRKLMGVVVENACVSVLGTKFKAKGPLLVTHWGMSGPVILKLSSYAAKYLSEKQYDFNIHINWVDESNHDLVKANLDKIIHEHANKSLSNIRPYFLPTRLWHFLIEKSRLPLNKKWRDLGKKGKNKIMQLLVNDLYSVKGKSAFKEEFVTCGGVSLLDVDLNTMQSKVSRNIYFAGEVLDIDGITGGFNFQAAWSTAFLAAKLM